MPYVDLISVSVCEVGQMKDFEGILKVLSDNFEGII